MIVTTFQLSSLDPGSTPGISTILRLAKNGVLRSLSEEGQNNDNYFRRATNGSAKALRSRSEGGRLLYFVPN